MAIEQAASLACTFARVVPNTTLETNNKTRS